MSIQEVNKILKTKPFKVIKNGGWSYLGYKCNENVISISICNIASSYDYGVVNGVNAMTFNAPIIPSKIDFK